MDKFDEDVKEFENLIKYSFEQLLNQSISVKINIGLGPINNERSLFTGSNGCFGELFIDDRKVIDLELFDPNQNFNMLKPKTFDMLQKMIIVHGIIGLRDIKLK